MEKYLIFVDIANNNNKFWSAKVENNILVVEWGRVGCKAQQKNHECRSYEQAVLKFHSLVHQKKSKGYSESQAEVNSSTDAQEIRTAINFLELLKPYVAQCNYNIAFSNLLERYLRIVPTPAGTKIVPERLFRSVDDVDHQLNFLNAMLESHEPSSQAPTKITSLKSLGKNFWRQL